MSFLKLELPQSVRMITALAHTQHTHTGEIETCSLIMPYFLFWFMDQHYAYEAHTYIHTLPHTLKRATNMYDGTHPLTYIYVPSDFILSLFLSPSPLLTRRFHLRVEHGKRPFRRSCGRLFSGYPYLHTYTLTNSHSHTHALTQIRAHTCIQSHPLTYLLPKLP